jgi:hypothetical protein
MAVTGLLYGKMFIQAFNAEIDFDTHAIKTMLTTSTYVPDQDADDFKSDVTNEVSATGYTAAGDTLTTKTVTYTGGTNKFMLDGDNHVWTITGSMTARVAVTYDANAGTDATRPLIGYQLSTIDVTCTDSTWTLAWAAAGIVEITVS